MMLQRPVQTSTNHPPPPLDASHCALLAVLGTVAHEPSPFDKVLEKARASAAPVWCPVMDVMECAFHKAHARDMIQGSDFSRDLDRKTPCMLSTHGWASFHELMSGTIQDTRPLGSACIVLKMQFIHHVEEHRRADILNEIERHLTCARQSAAVAASMTAEKPAASFACSGELARIDCELAWVRRLRRKCQQSGFAA